MKAIKRDCMIVQSLTDLLSELRAALHNQVGLRDTQLQIIYFSADILMKVLELRACFPEGKKMTSQ